MDTTQLIENLKNIMQVFNIFIGIIGIISLILTFFLLLVSTRQNVKDNIWEYGVLRSMGFTKSQGQRLYMYEAFFTVIAASMCGVLIGVLTSTLVTAQFYLFLELPLVVQVPWILAGTVLTVSFSTTYFAVLIPIADVNKRRIASVLKSGS
jgi:ABC-type antimicrobial peptide transport system permease subunit